MALRKLTPHLAFKAAFDLQQQQEIINGHTLWLKVGKLGSLTTAKKWADLWLAIGQGEPSDYQELYQHIKNGTEIVAEASEEPEIPQAIQTTGSRFLTEIYSKIEESFEQDAISTRELCSGWVEEARAKELTAVTQNQALATELREAQTQIKELESQSQQLQNHQLELQATITELRAQLELQSQERRTVETEKLDLSRRLGISEQLCQQQEAELNRSQHFAEQAKSFRLKLKKQKTRYQKQLTQREQKIALLITRSKVLRLQCKKWIQSLKSTNKSSTAKTKSRENGDLK